MIASGSNLAWTAPEAQYFTMIIVKRINKMPYCYALWQPGLERGGRTYVGYTTDPLRRLRQHNGEIKGGARRTRTGGKGTWEILFVIEVEVPEPSPTKLFGKHEALSLEWHLKRNNSNNNDNRSTRGVGRRIVFLAGALLLKKFSCFLPHVVVWVDPRHVDAVWATLARLLPSGACCVEALPGDKDHRRELLRVARFKGLGNR